MEPYILVLDEGTTSTRAVLFNKETKIVDEEQLPLAITTPQFGFVEQDPNEIIEKSIRVVKAVVERARANERNIQCLAITNQRTATTVMDRATGKPLSPVISWQDARAADDARKLAAEMGEEYTARTGLMPAAANCGLHILHLFKNEDLKARSGTGELLIGTPDTLVIKALTGNDYTSSSNASSTGLLDQHTGEWWQEFIERNGASVHDLPTVLPEDGDYGYTRADVVGAEIPVRAVVADQQSALFGHGGLKPGSVKCTHGTGSFIDFNIGDRIVTDTNGLDNRFAWRTAGSNANIIEGSTWVSGSAIEWLIDDMKVLRNAAEIDKVCTESKGLETIVVPALAGFAAPYWDGKARGTVFGLSRHTTSADIVRATIEGIAHTVVDLLELITSMAGTEVSVLTVDGGLSRSNYLQQFTADLLNATVERTSDPSYVTARGAAWMAGVNAGVWESLEDAAKTLRVEQRFEPQMSEAERLAQRKAWRDAIDRSLGWTPKLPQEG